MEELIQLTAQFKLEKDTAMEAITARDAALKSYLENLDKVASKIASLSESYKRGVTDILAEHEIEKKSLQDTRTVHKEAKENHAKALIKMDEDISARTKATDELVDKSINLNKTNGGLTEEKRVLTEQVKNLTGQASIANRQLDTVKGELAALTPVNDKLKLDHAELLTNHEIKKKEFSDLNTEIAILSARNK